MDLFKEKMETWQGKLVRLKEDCTTGKHIYPKGLLMRINCVSTKQVKLQTISFSLHILQLFSRSAIYL